MNKIIVYIVGTLSELEKYYNNAKLRYESLSPEIIEVRPIYVYSNVSLDSVKSTLSVNELYSIPNIEVNEYKLINDLYQDNATVLVVPTNVIPGDKFLDIVSYSSGNYILKESIPILSSNQKLNYYSTSKIDVLIINNKTTNIDSLDQNFYLSMSKLSLISDSFVPNNSSMTILSKLIKSKLSTKKASLIFNLNGYIKKSKTKKAS